MRLAPACLVLLLVASSARAQEAVAYEAWTWPGHLLHAPTEPGPPALTPADDWFGRDKAMHAGASFLLTLAGQYALTNKLGSSNAQALPVAALTALGLGLVKEVADSRRPVQPLFSRRDLVADALGVLLAAGVVAW